MHLCEIMSSATDCLLGSVPKGVDWHLSYNSNHHTLGIVLEDREHRLSQYLSVAKAEECRTGFSIVAAFVNETIEKWNASPLGSAPAPNPQR